MQKKVDLGLTGITKFILWNCLC